MKKLELIRQIIFKALIIVAYGKPDCANREDLSGILRSLGSFKGRQGLCLRFRGLLIGKALKVHEVTQHHQGFIDYAIALSIRCYLFVKLREEKINKKQCDTPDIEKFYE